MDTLQWASVKEEGLNHEYYIFRVFRAFRGLNDFYYSCPFVSIRGSPSPMDARRNRRAGALERANHALPSPFSSLLPTASYIMFFASPVHIGGLFQARIPPCFLSSLFSG